MLAGYLQHGPACLRKKPDPGLPMLRIVTLMGVGERTSPTRRRQPQDGQHRQLKAPSWPVRPS